MAAFEVLDFWPDWDAAAGGAAVTVTWSAAGSTAAPPGPPCVMFGDALARPFSQPSAAPVLPACRMPHGRHPPWHRAAACRAALCCRTRCEALSGCAQRQSGRCAPPLATQLRPLDMVENSSVSRRPRRCPPRCCARACCAARRRRTRRAPCGCAWRWTATRARAATRCPSASARPPQRPRTPTRAPPASRSRLLPPPRAGQCAWRSCACSALVALGAVIHPATDRPQSAQRSCTACLPRSARVRMHALWQLSTENAQRASACQPRRAQRCHICHVSVEKETMEILYKNLASSAAGRARWRCRCATWRPAWRSCWARAPCRAAATAAPRPRQRPRRGSSRSPSRRQAPRPRPWSPAAVTLQALAMLLTSSDVRCRFGDRLITRSRQAAARPDRPRP